MATSTLKKFLDQINGLLRDGNGAKLREYLVLEPPFGQAYAELIAELQQSFPDTKEPGPTSSSKRLEKEIETHVPEREHSSPGFTNFLLLYLFFIRDVEKRDVATIFESLREVMKSLSALLGHSTIGPLMFETALLYCQTLARFTRQLLTTPHLTAAFIDDWNSKVDTPVSLPGLAVETIRPILEKCAPYPPTKANTGLDENGRPERNRANAYRIANLCFPLCLRTNSMEALEGIIQQIDSKGIALSHYPRPQRVTYLYYLGRFWFSYNHFFRAQVVLNEAYLHTPAQFQKQRTLVLTYLMASNIILGRFPSRQLLLRPEAATIGPHFSRLCQAIRQGDLPRFRSLVDLQSRDPSDTAAAQFFFRRRMLFQIRNRCEVLVQRALLRRVFVLDGFHGDAATKAAPNFDLTIARNLIVQLEKRAAVLSPAAEYALSDAMDPDFDGCEDVYYEYGFDEEDAEDEDSDGDKPSLAEVEGCAASLIYQGLLHGNISHRLAKVIITGAKGKNAMEVGFPRICAITNRGEDAKNIPGWKNKDVLT